MQAHACAVRRLRTTPAPAIPHPTEQTLGARGEPAPGGLYTGSNREVGDKAPEHEGGIAREYVAGLGLAELGFRFKSVPRARLDATAQDVVALGGGGFRLTPKPEFCEAQAGHRFSGETHAFGPLACVSRSPLPSTS